MTSMRRSVACDDLWPWPLSSRSFDLDFENRVRSVTFSVLDQLFFWLGIQYDSIVWIIMRRRGVSSERRRSSCSSYNFFMSKIPVSMYKTLSHTMRYIHTALTRFDKYYMNINTILLKHILTLIATANRKWNVSWDYNCKNILLIYHFLNLQHIFHESINRINIIIHCIEWSLFCTPNIVKFADSQPSGCAEGIGWSRSCDKAVKKHTHEKKIVTVSSRWPRWSWIRAQWSRLSHD